MSELLVLADLLNMADDEFGNHGCNDYELDNTPENYNLVKDALEWNGDSEDREPTISPDGKTIYTQDYFLMGYFAYLCRKLDKEQA